MSAPSIPHPAPADPLGQWATRYIQSEIEEAILRRTLVESQKQAEPVPSGRLKQADTPHPAWEIPAHWDGAAPQTNLQLRMELAYGIYLDQRKQLTREGLALAEEHKLSIFQLGGLLAGRHLPKDKMETFYKDVAEISKGGPSQPPRYGVTFTRTENPENPMESWLSFERAK